MVIMDRVYYGYWIGLAISFIAIVTSFSILKHQLNIVTARLDEQSDRHVDGEDDYKEGNNGSAVGGTTYARWGRTTCPDTAELIYEGWLSFSMFMKLSLVINNFN